MEAATSGKRNLPAGENERSVQQPSDRLQAIQTALINARSAQSAGSGVQPAGLQAEGLGSQEQRTEYERQNDQEQKGHFRQQHDKEESEYLGREREASRGRDEVKAGWLIPAVLEQQLNSDLPGLIRALVREYVYDTVTRKFILIPAGSALVRVYTSHVRYVQKPLKTH